MRISSSESPQETGLLKITVKKYSAFREAGVQCVCYNFMPVFDWTRNAAGSYASRWIHISGLLCGTGGSGESAEKRQRSDFAGMGRQLYARRVTGNCLPISGNNRGGSLGESPLFSGAGNPVAAEANINMAVHQDDPCWSIFGLPRILTGEQNLDRFLKLVDDPHNGLTLCCGSLGCSPKNDVPKLAAK